MRRLAYGPYGAQAGDTAPGTATTRQYIGETYDASGLSYLNARYYDGARGQFLSQDPAFWNDGFDLADPQSMNAYAYARNNPISMSDKDGEMFAYFMQKAASYVIRNSPNVPHSIRQADFAYNNPVAAYRIGSAYDNGKGGNLSSIASNFAINTTKSAGIQDSNALRHVVWQAVIANQLGVDIATQVGNAHEDNPLVNLENRTFNNRDSADQTADLLNNQIGRGLYLSNPKGSNVDYAKSAIEYMYNQGLYGISESKEGGFNVIQMKINSSQYNAALKAIGGLKQTGLKK